MVDSASLTSIVIISNTIVQFTLLIAYLYRAKIEKKQIEIMIKNAESKAKLEKLCKMVRLERKELMKMNSKELEDFLNHLEELGNGEDD